MLRLSDPHALQPILRRCITILDFTGVLITYLWGRDCAVIGDHLQQASSRFDLWLFGPVLFGCCRCAPVVHHKVLQPCAGVGQRPPATAARAQREPGHDRPGQAGHR